MDKAAAILVFGHLYVDSLVEGPGADPVKVQAGGTGFNAARAFKEQGFAPVVVGRVGRDPEATLVRRALVALGITALLGEDPSRPTGRCRINLNAAHLPHRFEVNPDNANFFDREHFAASLSAAEAAGADLAFVAFNLLRQLPATQAASFLELVRRGGRTLILDLVPHDLYERIELAELRSALGAGVDVLIAEFRTVMRFLEPRCERAEPTADDWQALFAHFPAAALALRWGVDNISHEEIRERLAGGSSACLAALPDTGYVQLPRELRPGFGDRLTARFVWRLLPRLARMRSPRDHRGAV